METPPSEEALSNDPIVAETSATETPAEVATEAAEAERQLDA